MNPEAVNSWPDEAWRYPKHVRVATRLFNLLPFPLGVECLAFGRASTMWPGRHGRLARAWAARHRDRGAARRRLAFGVLVNRVRFHAISALVGARHPDLLRERTEIRGVEHLERASAQGATLLLNFHIGPPGTFLALRVLGWRLTFVGLLAVSGRWERKAWTPYLDPSETISLGQGDVTTGTRAMLRARHTLQRGGIVLMMGDGPVGDVLCRLPVRGGEIVLRPGWLAVRRATHATTLPLLSRWEDHRRIIEIAPPLPPPVPDIDRDVAACRDALAPFLATYVAQYPDQCPLLALWKDGRPG